MKILMLSWEYPPKNVGGFSNHVYYLSKSLNKLGHEIHVITCEEGTAPIEEVDDGVYIYRVAPYKIETNDFIKWVTHLNFSMIEEAIRLIRKIGKFDIIHAHDWLSCYSGKVLKWSYRTPLISTIHATEYGRNNGIRTEMQKYISSAEWMLTYESWKVVACSQFMKKQISEVFSTPSEKVWVIPNGIDCDLFNIDFDYDEFRRRFANDNEKIVFYVGRHVFEKGIHLLIDAIPQIIGGYHDTKFIIAGSGPMTEELKYKVKNMGLENRVIFVGYMDDNSRNKMYKVADAAVFPSLYEPFGIVALEAMAAGCPVVVSDSGGLGEIVQHKYNGMKTIPGLSQSIGDNVLEIFLNQELENYIKTNALNTALGEYSWTQIGELTSRLYNEVKSEAINLGWWITDNGANIFDSKEEVKPKNVESDSYMEVATSNDIKN